MIKAMKGSFKMYQERVSAKSELAARKTRFMQEAERKANEQRNTEMDIECAKKMLANAELLIAKGMKAKSFEDIESGQTLLKKRQVKLAASLKKLENAKQKCVCQEK